MINPVHKITNPALVVLDVHNFKARIKGSLYNFKLPPEGNPKTRGYFQRNQNIGVAQGMDRTLQLIEFAKSCRMPIGLAYFRGNAKSGAEYELPKRIREATRNYPHLKHIVREEPYVLRSPEFLAFLQKHGADSIILCGGDMFVCALNAAKGLSELGLPVITSFDTLYRNIKAREAFGDCDYSAFDDHIHSAYSSFAFYDPNHKGFMGQFATDIRNLKWYVSSIMNAKPVDAYDRHVFQDILLPSARNILSQRNSLISTDRDMAKACESFDLSAPSELLGYGKVTPFYIERTLAHENVGELIKAVQALLRSG